MQANKMQILFWLSWVGVGIFSNYLAPFGSA